MRQMIFSSVSVSFVWFVLVARAQAQAVPAAATEAKAMSDGTTTASRLVSISGVLQDKLGKPLTGVQGVTFALYKEQSSGSPLWLETQNVTADSESFSQNLDLRLQYRVVNRPEPPAKDHKEKPDQTDTRCHHPGADHPHHAQPHAGQRG